MKLRILVLSMLWAAVANAQPASEQHQNIVGVELLGRAVVYSANYERRFTPRFSVGAGAAGWSIDGSTAIIVPLYIAATPFKGTHSPYAGMGVTFASGKSGVASGFETATFGTVTLGYQFRSSSGFILRPATNLFFSRNEHIWWPGVMIGHSF